MINTACDKIYLMYFCNYGKENWATMRCNTDRPYNGFRGAAETMKFLRKVADDLVTNLPATKLDYTEIKIDT